MDDKSKSAIEELEQLLDERGYACVLSRDWAPGATWLVTIRRVAESCGGAFLTTESTDFDTAIMRAVERVRNEDWNQGG